MKQILIISLLTLLSASALADDLLDEYVREAVEHNPSYQAALDRVAAYDARIPQAGALPDPMVGLALANIPVDSWELNQEPMTQKGIKLSQSFPFPGTLKLKRSAAESERDAQSASADEARLALIQQVRETYHRWAGLRETISITQQTRDLMNQMADVALAAYKVGKGTQQNILRAQSESLMLEDRLLELHQHESTYYQRMLTLLNRSPEDSLTAPAALAAAGTPADLDSLTGLLSEYNPRLRKLDLRVDASRTQERIAGKQNFPMFSLGTSYMIRESTPAGDPRSDFLSFEIGTTIPLFQRNKQHQLVQQRKLETRQLESERLDLLNQLRFRLTDLHNRQQTLNDQANIYTSAILPQNRQVVDAALADYQTGRGDFDALISAQRDLLRSEQMLINRRTDLLIADSQLDELIGLPRLEEN